MAVNIKPIVLIVGLCIVEAVSFGVGRRVQHDIEQAQQTQMLYEVSQTCASYDRIEPQTAILRCVQTICRHSRADGLEDISTCLNARTH